MRHFLILGATALTLLAATTPAFAQDHDHEGRHGGGGGGGRPAGAPAARPAPTPQAAGPAPSAPVGGFNRGQGAPGGYGGRRDAGSGGFRERGYGVQPVGPGSGAYTGRGGGQAAPGQGAPVAPGSGGYAGRGYRQAAPAAQGFGGYAGRGQADYGARDRGAQGFSGQRFGGAGGGYDRRGGGYGGGYGGGRSFSYRGRSFSAFRARPYVFPRGYGYRRYALHAFLPALFLSSTWYLDDWAAYDLGPPPSAHFRWVRYGPDALLVDSYTGEVVDTAYGVFDDGSGYGAAGAYDGGYEDGPPPYPAPRPY